MGSLTLLYGKVPPNYFSDDVVEVVRNKVTNMLSKDFVFPYEVDRESVFRVLQRVLEDRIEPLSNMITRAVMEIVNEIKTFELERTKHLKFENYFEHTQKIYDISSRSGPDTQTIKLSRQPSTLRFYHTYSTYDG
jgi:hypothetical protein